MISWSNRGFGIVLSGLCALCVEDLGYLMPVEYERHRERPVERYVVYWASMGQWMEAGTGPVGPDLGHDPPAIAAARGAVLSRSGPARRAKMCAAPCKSREVVV